MPLGEATESVDGGEGRASLQASLLFHLNLSYSAVEVEERPRVVRSCYRPLLELLEGRPWLKLAIEASGHTLERLERLDPEWVERLRESCDAGRVEFVGSGDAQIIGPLVPAQVNAWNQRLGREGYERVLGRAPRSALVNEMAWSQGLVDAYLDAGYDLLLMEWNNPRRSHPEWDEDLRWGTVRTPSPSGRTIELAWVDAVAFQKFQRAIAGDLAEEEYVDWVLGHAAAEPRHLFLYANDAEVFGYRPGRYTTEPPLEGGEWQRMGALLDHLSAVGVRFTTPRELLDEPSFRAEETLTLTSAADPIPVKKQPKYNVTRWALTGRDDIGLNTTCHAWARELERSDGSAEEWRVLCRAWASDLRTHLTTRRWDALRRALPECDGPEPPHAGPELLIRRVGGNERRLIVESDDVEVVLLPRRGLAIESLRFRSVSERELLGTLPHGHFDDIDWAADFYSGHTVLELPARQRVTDLVRVEPEIEHLSDRIRVTAQVETPLGSLEKIVDVLADRIELAYGFGHWGERPLGSLRTAALTLRDDAFGPDLHVTCADGGEPERFDVFGEVDHGSAVSALITASAALGATDGRLQLDDGRVGVDVSWEPWCTAALPLVTHRTIGRKRFVRVAFSLAEIDETQREGAPLRDFRVSVRGRRLAA